MLAFTSRRAAASLASAAAVSPPIRLLEVELTEPLPAVSFDGHHRWLWVLGRLHTEPVGACLVPVALGGLAPDHLGELLWREFGSAVSARLTAAGLPGPGPLAGPWLAADADSWPFLRRRAEVLADAPLISVVVCTRDRPQQLQTCLDHLDRQAYPRFEVIVVDNVPSGDETRELVGRRPGSVPYTYLVEPRAGASWARNTGIAAAAGEIIAFLDDDDEPDRYWLAGLASGFARSGDLGCVTGLIVPARLDTPAEFLFEQLGGHSKGRGFAGDMFSPSGPQDPLYPSPPFGTGANMAFRRETLAAIGGFDVALGPGTPARAGEDTLAFTLTLLAGYSICYEPAALVRHHHRRDLAGLREQLHGYSIGLTAYYTALVRHRPDVLAGLFRKLPSALAYLRNSSSPATVAATASRAALNRRHRRGMVKGPAAYLRSMRAQARAASRCARSQEGH